MRFNGPSADVYNHVELFGCDGKRTIPLNNFSAPIYHTAGVYLQESDSVLLCGGRINSLDTDECWTWTPSTGDNWVASSKSLVNTIDNHVMFRLPVANNTDKTSTFPVVMGKVRDTEMKANDPVDGDWTPYHELPIGSVLSTNCFIHYDDAIYIIKDRVYKLDPYTWTYEDWGLVPLAMSNAGQCVGVHIGGRPGILIRYGYWYDIGLREWRAKTPPPHYPFTTEPFPLTFHSYNGKPTMFGNLECDANTDCRATEIVQYEADTDSWTHIGSMIQEVSMTDVIEVPTTVCQHFTASPTTTTTTTTTNAPPTTITPDPSVLEKVALIVGGYFEAGLSTIELFGCPGMETSKFLGKFPVGLQLTAMTYIEAEDHVLMCGGGHCNVTGSVSCVPDVKCYRWYRQTGAFIYDSSMAEERMNYLLTQVPEIGSGNLMPVTIGDVLATEKYDSASKSWSSYRNTSASWTAQTHCLVHYNGLIYAMASELEVLDPSDWSITTLLTPIEDDIGNARCVGLTINGQPGLFTRYGFWLNLNSLQWEKKALPPYRVQGLAVRPPNEMWSFRGRPTIFGFPICNNEGVCFQQGILQYDPQSDSWEEIGTLREPRAFQEVIEVPIDFCNDPPRKTAVVILGGGSEDQSAGSGFTASAEIFGCDDNDVFQARIADFPEQVLIPSGVFLEDRGVSDADRVLFCGGYYCNATGTCRLEDSCFSWNSRDNAYTPDNDMGATRWTHMMTNLVDSRIPDSTLTQPVILGYRPMSEIYDRASRTWSNYLLLEGTDNWYTATCFVNYNGGIYYSSNVTYRLDPETWLIETLGVVPEGLQPPGRCAGIDIDGTPGLMIRSGFWLNLESMVWEVKAPEPFNPKLYNVDSNSVWPFRGMPTVFGSGECDDNATCLYKRILQYNAVEDEWRQIGDMIFDRVLHDVVEVPGYYCDSFGTLTPPTTVTTAPPTTTATSSPPTTPTSAAIVFGGFYDGDGDALNSFEVFGCPSLNPTTFTLGTMPLRMHSAAGVYLPNDDNVLICGGVNCPNDPMSGSCSDSNACHVWNPTTGDISVEAPMAQARSNFMLSPMGANDYPVALGGQVQQTEMFDTSASSWSNYRDLPDSSWENVEGCIARIGDFIYRVNDTVVR